MKCYFFVAKNREGLIKSGVIKATSAFDAYSTAYTGVNIRSDDKYELIKLEVVE